MLKKRINEYVAKYGYDFVLNACDDAENRKIYLKKLNIRTREENIARIKAKARELGVKLYG